MFFHHFLNVFYLTVIRPLKEYITVWSNLDGIDNAFTIICQMIQPNIT